MSRAWFYAATFAGIGTSRTALRPLTMIASGVLSGLLAAAFQAAGARYLELHQQGHLAVALTLGTFAGQLFAAYVFEAKLAAGVDPGSIRYPRVLLVGTLLAAAAVVVVPEQPLAYLVGAPLLLGATQASRMFSVIRHHVRKEVFASCVLGLGGLTSLVLMSQNSMRVLALTGAAAVLARHVGLSAPPKRTRPTTGAWVFGETFATGLALPAMSAVVLLLLGPADAVAFRVLLTVSAALEPALAYLRTRLLVRESAEEARLVFLLMVAASAGLLLLGALDAFSLVFGQAWRNVPPGALAVAVLWKMCSLPVQIPFTSLRRKGRVVIVFVLRVFSLLVYMVLALPAAQVGGLRLVFAAFAAAELLIFVPYWLVDRRTHSRS